MDKYFIELPAELYEIIRHAAAQRNRAVDQVVIESLALLFSDPVAHYDDIYAALDNYSDEQLWGVVYHRLSWEEQNRRRQLVEKIKTLTVEQTNRLLSLNS